MGMGHKIFLNETHPYSTSLCIGGCDVTPAGYAHMTSLLSTLSAGRTLVILEGGYNLRSISASAAAVVKVCHCYNSP